MVICGRRKEPLDAGGGADRRTTAARPRRYRQTSATRPTSLRLEAAAQRHGSFDVLVNNAMAYSWGAIEATSTRIGTAISALRWTAPFGAPARDEADENSGGAIINVSSICGLLGTPMMAGYSAAKAAIINFSRAAAAEGAAENIRVNVVIPAVVETPATAGMLCEEKSRRSTEKLISDGPCRTTA